MKPCLVCISTTGFDPWYKSIQVCRTCGFHSCVHVSAPQDGYEEDYFCGGEYPDYLGQQDTLRASMRRHLQQMSRHMSLKGQLFELGCAYGLFLDEAKKYFEVRGMDVGHGPTHYAKEKLGLPVVRGELLESAEIKKVYDVICLWDTIEHLQHPHLTLSRLLSMLKPGGRLFLTTGDLGSIMALWRGKNWRQIHPPTHLHYFSRRCMERLLLRLGYDEVQFETASYCHSMLGILSTLSLRKGVLGGLATLILKILPHRWLKNIRIWLNLGDIMFVTAIRRSV